MPTPHVAYAVQWAAAGCLADSTSGPYLCATRGELAELIRSEVEAYGLPASRFAEVGLRRLWRRIQHAGSASSCGFSLPGPGSYSLHFEGLTRDEADAMEAAADY